MPDAIDDYVSAVGSELRGSPRLRADMLAEIRAALLDAAESHERDGLTAGEARQAAVQEFGAAHRIAAGLQEVLALIHGRRTALLLLVVLGVQHAAAELVGRLGCWRMFWGDAEPGAGYLWLARATDLLSVLTLLAALVPVLLLRHGLRRGWVRTPVVRVTALSAAVVVTLIAGCVVLLTVLPASADPVATLVGVSGAVLPPLPVLVSARRSWLAAARPDGSPAHCGDY